MLSCEPMIIEALLDRARKEQDRKAVFVPDIRPESFSDVDLINVTKSQEPSRAFQELVYDKFYRIENELRDSVVKDILNDDEVKVPAEERGEAAELIRQTMAIEYPLDNLLGTTEVLIDLIVEQPDWFPNDTDRMPEDPCAILWLVKQQGYRKSDLKKALKEGGSDNRFLDSVVHEMGNAATDRNLLTFFFRMTMNEYIDMMSMARLCKCGYSHGYIRLKNDVACGLYDAWNGGGGTMGIRCENTVRIPFSAVASACHDGALSVYSARRVFGVNNAAWDWSYMDYVLTTHEPKQKELKG